MRSEKMNLKKETKNENTLHFILLAGTYRTAIM